jgi:hypothetical protein
MSSLIRTPYGVALAVVLTSGVVAAATHFALSNSEQIRVAEQAAVRDVAVALANPFGSLANAPGIFGPPPATVGHFAALETLMQRAEPAPSSPEPTVEAAPQPSEPDRAVVQDAPFPPRRPLGDLPAAQPRERRVPEQAVAAAPPADNRGFFEKIFNVQPTSPGPALAYARTEEGSLGNSLTGASRTTMGAYGPGVAVYDISARAVFMPNGEKLEAHSGLGELLDDPNRVNEKNRGATPPNVYDLKPREALFHGVPALRLTPIGNANTYGRTGLLAHTYMLGPNGDSNGCISFKDYGRFLQAYHNGEVKRLVVVTRRT